MLSVKNLEVVYQDVILVLRGISFEIPKGEIVSLLGSNGSGKTTALRAITGLLDTQNGDITKGQITIEDEDITNAQPSKIVNLGWVVGDKLSQIYRSCDFFIFPSKTDTFGQVMVEAMASGLPVAAYNVIGPNDVVIHNKTGYLSDNIERSCQEVLKLKKKSENIAENCVNHSQLFSWDTMIQELIKCQPNSNRNYYLQYHFIFAMFYLFFYSLSYAY